MTTEGTFREAVESVRRGDGGFRELIAAFGAHRFILLSRTNPANSAPDPLIFSKDERTELAVFTSAETASQFTGLAKFALILTGAQILSGRQAGVGLVVDPGSQSGFSLESEALDSVS